MAESLADLVALLKARAEETRAAPSRSVYKDGRADGLEYAALLLERFLAGEVSG